MDVRSTLGGIAVSALAAAALAMPAPVANATDADAQFLSVLADLGIVFPTSDEAVEAGNNVCDIVAEGSANNVDPARIRSDIVASMMGEGLTDADATQLMWSAVDAYCPQYNAVAGG
ncbi:DUF732 domain-containing protein [Mycobacterium sp. Y57]|uniref:DUF732 domain-containing protein n=1 Tax=Mycolicibacterium xanthum TaxID=2796469 RepID=UPI001C840D90|nr:DUF732 domain-containing protein [Mycolicibacterium xanthum]MBX7435113.1 DUF732 domain-containing protein [Mycolicibacterium xanthum]